MEKYCLVNKKCTPCKGDTSAMSQMEVENFLHQLDEGWILTDQVHLYKKFLCKNFESAMDFANKIALIAEQEKHHPKLTIWWGSCEVEIWTHAINGLSENDFILAAKVAQAYATN